MSDDRSQAYEDKQGPLPLVEDVDTDDRFLIYQTESGVTVELQLAGDTFWASQRQIAEAFGVTSRNVTIHLGNIFREVNSTRRQRVRNPYTLAVTASAASQSSIISTP